jgi:hypothetical protein
MIMPPQPSPDARMLERESLEPSALRALCWSDAVEVVEVVEKVEVGMATMASAAVAAGSKPVPLIA